MILTFVLVLMQATVEIQQRIDALETERAQLLQLQRDCTPANKAASIAAMQAIIDKLIALKTEPQATPDIDAIFDELIARFESSQKDFDAVTPGRPCTRELGAAARLSEIASQLAKLEVLKNR